LASFLSGALSLSLVQIISREAAKRNKEIRCLIDKLRLCCASGGRIMALRAYFLISFASLRETNGMTTPRHKRLRNKQQKTARGHAGAVDAFA
jgi:hypothetical protein